MTTLSEAPMTEMDELKPCPFCGYAPTGEEELLDILDVDEFGEKVEKIKYVGVSCAGCYAYVPVQTNDKTEAVAAWNRRASLSPAGVTEEQVEAAWREETESEHLARDIREGNFPSRSDRQLVPNVDDAWTRIGKDPELERAIQKLSMHEIRLIIRHASSAALEAAAKVRSPADAKGGA